MHGWISWLARNPVAANLLMIILVVSGLLAITGIRGEVFPEVPLDEVSIQVTYLGAGPEEVESAVVTRIRGGGRGHRGRGRDPVDRSGRQCAGRGRARRRRRRPPRDRRDHEPGRGDRDVPGRGREADSPRVDSPEPGGRRGRLRRCRSGCPPHAGPSGCATTWRACRESRWSRSSPRRLTKSPSKSPRRPCAGTV